MNIDDRIKAFAQLSRFMKAVANTDKALIPDGLQEDYENFQRLIPRLYDYNGWFAEEFVRYQLDALADASTEKKLRKWLVPYQGRLEKIDANKTVAVIMAGNIPFVGFSDFIAVLISGYRLLAKLSSKDTLLPKAIAQVLVKISPEFEDKIILTEERISGFDFDAVIATGSDNTARYFEYYFGKYPNIIRRNRTSVAVLTGDETEADLERLADDVFLYFGLGCRNVSKIYIPQDFDINRLFKAFYRYRHIIDYHKYANNYEYNRAIYLLNRERFFDNGFILLKEEDLSLVSPTAVVFYQRYSNWQNVPQYLEAFRNKIQCVVSNNPLEGFAVVPLGQAQRPMLWDWPDDIDVMEFLLQL